jgi:hypothetical protein
MAQDFLECREFLGVAFFRFEERAWGIEGWNRGVEK